MSVRVVLICALLAVSSCAGSSEGNDVAVPAPGGDGDGGGPASIGVPIDTGATGLLAAWTQGVDRSDGVVLDARWVLDGTEHACEDWTVTDGSKPVSGVVRTPDPRPADFDITVCAAPIPNEWRRPTLAMGGQTVGTLPAWGDVNDATAAGRPVITLGDTGCRGGGEQDCDSTEWGFPGVMESAVGSDPALYVHVGDYRYRGELNNVPDSWNAWQEDLFSVLNQHGQTAPWIFSRGNHEQCPPLTPFYGPGWWYLLGPTSRTTCLPAGEPNPPELHPTWHVDLTVGTAEHRFVVIDTSDHRSGELQSRFAAALDLDLDVAAGYTRWSHHHPLLAVLQFGMPEPADGPARDAFAAALGASADSTPLCTDGRCVPQADIVGHEHFYERVQYRAPGGSEAVWPDTLLVGHGGVDLRRSGTEEDSCSAELTVVDSAGDSTTWDIHLDSAEVPESRSAFGYVQAVLADDVNTPDGWTLTPVFTGSSNPSFGSGGTPCTVRGGGAMSWQTDVAAGGSLGFPDQ